MDIVSIYKIFRQNVLLYLTIICKMLLVIFSKRRGFILVIFDKIYFNIQDATGKQLFWHELCDEI